MEPNHTTPSETLTDWAAEYTDPRLDRLSEMFDKVADPEDWKKPIRARVHAFDLADTVEAIGFYTATVAIIVDDGPGYYRVASPGYRAGPAGDH